MKKQRLDEHWQQHKAAGTTWKTQVAFALLLVYFPIAKSPLFDTILFFDVRKVFSL